VIRVESIQIPGGTMTEQSQKTSAITYILGTIALLASVGGVMLALTARMLVLRNGFPAWEAWPYPASAFLIWGLISGSLLGGFAAVTHYLHGIRDYAKEIAFALHLRKESQEASESADLSSGPVD